MDLPGRVAVVSGASSGIGAAVAVELARRGMRVVVAARRTERLAETVAQCEAEGAEALAQPADVSRPGDCAAVVAAAQDRFGAVDLLVNNAGISLHKPAQDTTVDEIEQLVRTNFLGAVHLTMAALPGMLERRRGWVVNVTSVAGYIPNPNESAYGATKAALSLWSHGLAVDLNGTGVRAGALSPGPIDTEIWEMDAVYQGKRYPPGVVAGGVVRMVTSDRVQLTVPRRYGAVGALYPLLGRPLRWGLRRFASKSSG